MGALLTTSSSLSCPHGGTVSITSSNTHAKADGSYIVRSSDTFTIAGCPFMLGSSPHPCVKVDWQVATMRNKAAGDPALADDSVGLCVAGDNAPQGTVLVNNTQRKASGV